jgi:hypothetical protein
MEGKARYQWAHGSQHALLTKCIVTEPGEEEEDMM